MPFGFYGDFMPISPPAPRIGKPDRGNRAKVKAGRRAARRNR